MIIQQRSNGLGEWWEAVPGAQAAYDFVTSKLDDWRKSGEQLPYLERTASAIQLEADTAELRQEAATIRQDLLGLRKDYNKWAPTIDSALAAIKKAFGLGAVPILALTLIVAAAAVVGTFLNRKSGAERSLLAMIDQLSPEARERVALRLAGSVPGKGATGDIADIARYALLGGVLYFGYKAISGRQG